MALVEQPEEASIPVGGGRLHALRFGAGPRIALAAHGITGSALAFLAVARLLPDDWTLVAVDLRGRGGSAGTPGPYGLARHAEDLCAAARHLGGGAPVTLTGHSMGAYAAVRAAAAHPELFDRVLLVDGGLPLPVPAGADLDALLDASLGPAIARLGMTYASPEAYVEFFRAHPALGPHWNEDVERYVRADLTGPEGWLRSRVRPEAVRADGRDLLASAASLGEDLQRLTVDALLTYAPLGMFGQAPGMLPEQLVAAWRDRAPGLRTELVPDTNHYTILMGAGAAVVTRRLTGGW
ncbi:alpha/beta hydrolase [Streptomyces sp. PTM05]|uniref:Alpha/beta hydrolase n=1 Tax=Streptantibioticus parmotrematis TaxID=2873249 RepID=A0ABS7QYL5_9ACTN|nr:alpha/beta hydrolase [Streptantibioticus parmotrematis]MBY8888308.1 alpha/beta hydrolase [Streptantibioticus parmotrematis]